MHFDTQGVRHDHHGAAPDHASRPTGSHGGRPAASSDGGASSDTGSASDGGASSDHRSAGPWYDRAPSPRTDSTRVGLTDALEW